MKTIQIKIDDELLQKIDYAFRLQRISRSQFICEALEAALHRLAIEELEQKQSEGYRRIPVTNGEFDIWESEQAWG